MRLERKVTLVTAGATGIGAGIVERFLQEGAPVVIFAINGEAAQERALSEDLLGGMTA